MTTAALTFILLLMVGLSVLLGVGTYFDKDVEHPLRPDYAGHRIRRQAKTIFDSPVASLGAPLSPIYDSMMELAPVVHFLPRADRRRAMRVVRNLARVIREARKLDIPISDDLLARIKQDKSWLDEVTRRAQRLGAERLASNFERSDTGSSIDTPRQKNPALDLHSALDDLAPALAKELRGAARSNAAIRGPALKIAGKLDDLAHKSSELDPNTLRQARSVTWHFLEALRDLRARGGHVKLSDLPKIEEIERFFSATSGRGEARIERDFSASLGAITDQIRIHGGAR